MCSMGAKGHVAKGCANDSASAPVAAAADDEKVRFLYRPGLLSGKCLTFLMVS